MVYMHDTCTIILQYIYIYTYCETFNQNICNEVTNIQHVVSSSKSYLFIRNC